MGDAWGKKKQPKIKGAPPATDKVPRRIAEPSSDYKLRPSWRLGRLDVGGPFCVSKLAREELVVGDPASGLGAVLERLKAFETMTWSEILNRQHHRVPFSGLTAEAMERVEALQLDDFDGVVSLRITSAQRVVGVLAGAVLEILWWDPEHRVCTSSYKD